MIIDLRNKKALVSGSTQGIGKAVAIQLAQSGASVTLIARNEEKLKLIISELETSNNQRHDYVVADFMNPEELKKEINKHIKVSKPYHILINNTGGPPAGTAINAAVEEFENAFQQHLVCNHTLTKALVPGMKKEEYGRIINIISTSVKQPLKGLGVSNTIRGAVANWSKTLANELGVYGITVNNILPGATKTARLDSIIENKAAKSGKTYQEVEQEMCDEVPVRRIGKPEEPAYAITFLASPLASYISGINVPIDGGRTGCL